MLSNRSVLLLAACAACVSVCAALDLGSVAGAVQDAVSGASLANVEVRVPLWPAYQKVNLPRSFKGNLKSDDDFVYTTTMTDTQGGYSVSIPLISSATANYDVQFNAPNYPRATISNVDVRVNEETQVPVLSYIDRTRSGPGDVKGVVKHALTGVGEPNVQLSFRSGNNIRSGAPIVQSVWTASDGSYFAVLQTGYYTMECMKGGFVTTYRNNIAIGGQIIGNQNVVISPALVAGETRIVLRWGENPRDLDSHITGPQGSYGEKFHVFYGNTGSKTASPYSFLDTDDRNGFGPETITISQQRPGVYRYSVHDYTNQFNTNSYGMSQCGPNCGLATVDLIHNGVTRTFNVPANRPGTLWTVFELCSNCGDGYPNGVRLLNSMTNHQNAGTVP